MEKKQTFRDLITANGKRKDSAENLPALMFRDVLDTHGISLSEWEMRMDRYFRRKYGNDVKRINSDKGNLMRSLAKDKITWDLWEIVKRILGPVRVKYTVQMTFADGRTYEHNYVVRYRENERRDECDDDSEE